MEPEEKMIEEANNEAGSKSPSPPLFTDSLPVVTVQRAGAAFQPPRLAQRSLGSNLLPVLLKKAEENRKNLFKNPQKKVYNEENEGFRSCLMQPSKHQVEDLELELQPSENNGCQFIPEEDVVKYSVLYAKPTTKKHKTWEGDGTLTIIQNGKEIVLHDESGELLASTCNFKLPEGFGENSEIKVGGQVVEIQELIKDQPKVEGLKPCSIFSSSPKYGKRRGDDAGVEANLGHSQKKKRIEVTDVNLRHLSPEHSSEVTTEESDGQMEDEADGSNSVKLMFNVLYSKPTTKKHKTWEGDGTLTVIGNGKEMILRDESGQVLTSAFNFKLPDGFGDGTQVQFGGQVVEVQNQIDSVIASSRVLDYLDKPNGQTINSCSIKGSRKFQAPGRLPESLIPKPNNEPSGPSGEYLVLYAQQTTDKFKAWEGDGTLTVIEDGKEMILRDSMDQLLVSVSDFNLPEKFCDGIQLVVGDKVVEICRRND